MPRKLGRTSKERNALLRGLATDLLWYGKIETTVSKAKELKSYVEKLITKAVNTYADNIEYEVTKKDAKGKHGKILHDINFHRANYKKYHYHNLFLTLYLSIWHSPLHISQNLQYA